MIDGDLRRPSIHHYLRLPNSSGLSSAFLANPSVLPSFLKQHPNNRLYVLTSGPIPPNPVEILGSAKMGTLIGLLREHFDVIIVDSPPMLGLADAGLWSTHCDGIVLVARQGRTHQGSLREAAIQASASHKPILGAVINDAKAGRAQAGYYEYTSTGRRRRFSLSNLRGALAPRRTAAQRSR